ncbi:unnamed protein product, partial [marine sediment metagenome]
SAEFALEPLKYIISGDAPATHQAGAWREPPLKYIAD